jgi:hypothetical protein
MLRDTLQSACKYLGRKTLPLPAPELNLTDPLFVRELRGEDIVFVSKSETGLEDRLRWAVRSLSDSSGNRVLNDGDLDWIGGDAGLPTPLIERAYWAARQVAGYTEENRKSFLTTSPAAAASGSPSN